MILLNIYTGRNRVGRESLVPLHAESTPCTVTGQVTLSVVLGGLLRAGALHAGGGPVEFSVEVSWIGGG